MRTRTTLREEYYSCIHTPTDTHMCRRAHVPHKVPTSHPSFLQEDAQVVLRRRRQNVVSYRNWRMLYYYANQDHAQADLIWNHYTREELRQRLEDEYRAFSRDKVSYACFDCMLHTHTCTHTRACARTHPHPHA